jgi:hypothetical protein
MIRSCHDCIVSTSSLPHQQLFWCCHHRGLYPDAYTKSHAGSATTAWEPDSLLVCPGTVFYHQ